MIQCFPLHKANPETASIRTIVTMVPLAPTPPVLPMTMPWQAGHVPTPRGVDLDRFRFRDPATYHSKWFVAGMVSRITPLKGHADFIKAVSILSRQIPNLKAVIVGGASKEKYKEVCYRGDEFWFDQPRDA